jgi:hypothetical protein
MRRNLQNLWVLLVCTILPGCVLFPQQPNNNTTVQIVTQYQLVIPDPSMIENCYSKDSGIELFDSEKYIHSNWPDKEKMLYEFLDKHLVVLEGCNKRFTTLRNWYEKQKAIYEKEASLQEKKEKTP